MAGCPSAESLQALLEDKLAAAARSDIVGHAEECGACRAVLVELVQAKVPAISEQRDVALWWTPPEQVEEYRLLSVLGRGSMGQVWLAEDTMLGRRVALKFIGGLSRDPEIRARFMTEARAVARLAHPNVVTIHRIGLVDGQPYTVTELVEGQSLDRVDKPFDSTRLLGVSIDLARGLAAAHRAGILHRDVKPANAMLGRDGCKLLDFGLATFSTDSDAEGPRRERSVAGTPYYLAPECWRGEAASRRSDVYSLGALLYELVAGKPPVKFLPEGKVNEVVVKHDHRPLADVAPHVDARIASVIDRCLERDPLARWRSADELRDALEQLAHAHGADAPISNPYRGLATYEAEHRSVFFGRRAESRAVIERLRSGNLLVVAGESGNGKSSLCRAAVLPAIVEGALGARAWHSATCLPGRQPLLSLAAACTEVLGKPQDEILADLRVEPEGLARALARALGSQRGFVLFIDQLEEWITIADREQAALAARAVYELCSGLQGLRVLATARSDLLAQLSTLPALGAELSSSLFLLGPVRAEHLRQIIAGPAATLGVGMEDAVVDELVQFAEGGGALPLLQFTLARLWDERGDRDVITSASLRAIGGVAGALARHADGVLASLPAQQSAAARRILLMLVGANDQRYRRSEDELVETDEVRRIALATLARERLVLARDSHDGTGWEIAHDTLLREWPMLARWLADDREARNVRDRLRAAAKEWERLGRKSDALWSAQQLVDIERTDIEASGVERAFLAASRRRARMRRWRVPLLVGAVLLAGATTFGVTRWNERRAVADKVSVALARARDELAPARAARPQWETEQRAAFHAFDDGDYVAGEQVWTRAVASRADWQRGIVRASAEIEKAQELDRSRDDVRALAIDIATEKLAFARATRNAAEADAARAQLESLGAQVDMRATARVTLAVSPPSASITIARYQDNGGHLELGDETAFAGEASLAPGSWQLRAEAPGYAEARLPFVTARGEDQQLTLSLVPISRVPDGFVVVPGGKSFFGAEGDDSVRRDFYEAPPLHQIDVPTFLVARHEITFGDWIAWLDTLDESERVMRMPRVAGNTGVTTGAHLSLARLDGAWTLSFTPVSTTYVARQHEHIRYFDRSVNADQDWLRMPVVGVTPVDVVAYASWLDRSGRVPGARLCREQEWERAARGADTRTLPHGELAEPLDGNIDVTYGRRDRAYGPDEVGRHPASRSPFGIDDALGNVWEVVQPLSHLKPFVSKGGSWNVALLAARIPNGWVINAQFRQVETGGRICVSLPD